MKKHGSPIAIRKEYANLLPISYPKLGQTAPELPGVWQTERMPNGTQQGK